METTISSPHKTKLYIPSVKGAQVVDVQCLMYIEADSNYSNLFFTDRSRICASRTMNTYATLLEDSNFVRVHKSFVVNLDHVTAYVKGAGSNVLMTNGKTIDVARSKREYLTQRMKEYFKH